MTIDLDRLDLRHPELPTTLARNLTLLAVVALERRHHPGVVLSVKVADATTTHVLTWQPVGHSTAAHVDQHRATEDGAEAIALGLVHELRGWRVGRRLQRRQYGDWLLEEQGTGRKIVFEVGGLDDGSLTAKLKGEVEQVRKSPLPYERAACVVRFADVAAMLTVIPHAPE